MKEEMKEEMKEVEWLENWYKKTCDGLWEHLYGIEIGTLDNPGWYVNIDLRETQYENLQMAEVNQDLGDDNWMSCTISNGIFRGVGDSLKLKEILNVFRNVIEPHADNAQRL